MNTAIESALLRDFLRLPQSLSVGEARQRFAATARGKRYGVVLDGQRTPLTCLSESSIDDWPDDQPLEAFRQSWPPLYVLPERDAVSVEAVVRFFLDEFIEYEGLRGIVLIDATRQPTAILTRRVLMSSQADTRGWNNTTRVLPAQLESYDQQPPTEGQLMVTRYSHLVFPALAALKQRVPLVITINRQSLPGIQQVELGLKARNWPLKVRVSLMGVAPEDFVVDGPSSGVIEVPRDSDSAPLTFFLIPQGLGEKEFGVYFEHQNDYVGTAIVRTTVVSLGAAGVANARIENAPEISARGLPPDVTLMIKRLGDDDRRYEVRARFGADDQTVDDRLIDRISFEKPPGAEVEEWFAELNAKPRTAAQQTNYDEGVAQLGKRLFDRLFHDPGQLDGLEGFKSFYWNQLFPLPEGSTLQIISDEPYIPWEILRATRMGSGGEWEPDPQYLCERFALTRWLHGKARGSKLSLSEIALVAPPSNLRFVASEVEAIEKLSRAATVMRINTKEELLRFLREGGADVVHFACHGRFDVDNPGRSSVILDKEQWQPGDLVGEYYNFASKRKPLVFLNVCDSGREGLGLTGIDGWAPVLINRAGVGFFIGSAWKTTDELASRLAGAFYEQLVEGRTIGEAMRQARRRIKQPGNATYLSYTVYGHPRIGLT